MYQKYIKRDFKKKNAKNVLRARLYCENNFSYFTV